eukprot:GFUD01108978.1.p1 GENE.GFUD01108978.1~~GFUD01108978.1.p1  ORF type:complete len:182 (+),score=50.94 GFUD01108978.1:43-546(+)
MWAQRKHDDGSSERDYQAFVCMMIEEGEVRLHYIDMAHLTLKKLMGEDGEIDQGEAGGRGGNEILYHNFTDVPEGGNGQEDPFIIFLTPQILLFNEEQHRQMKQRYSSLIEHFFSEKDISVNSHDKTTNESIDETINSQKRKNKRNVNKSANSQERTTNESVDETVT